MMSLEMFVRAPLANALGWTLVHSLWEGAILAILLAAVLYVTRSPRLRYAAACAAMFALFAGLVVTLALLFPHRSDAAPVLVTRLSGQNSVPHAPVDNLLGHGLLADLPGWLAPLWMLGALAFQLRAVASWFAVRRISRVGVCSAPTQWQDRLNQLVARLCVAKPVILLESALTETPAVVGHLKPLVLIPLGILANLSASQVEAVLLHELAHIRRYDYLLNLIQTWIESLLFYHPAIWWISRVIRTERENCCDDLVVATYGDSHQYAVALTALEQIRCAHVEPAVPATGGNLMQRIQRLLGINEGPRFSLAPVWVASFLVIASAFALVAWQQPPAPASRPATSAFTKWLNEDVVYIITPEERQAFINLQTDVERTHFIELFWERRNPAPGSPENKFKEEHYRRIAFANQRYASSLDPGWKTDRGRIYILYGPPDEIESHPQPTDHPMPFEQWRYRYIEGLGSDVVMEFVDRTLNGDYRLTTDPSPETASAFIPLGAGVHPNRIRVGANVQEHNLITKVEPVYAPLALQAGIQGTVRFQVTIGKDGTVQSMQLVSGHPLLVQSAQDALRQWIYKPTLLNGEPIEVSTVVDVKFTLP